MIKEAVVVPVKDVKFGARPVAFLKYKESASEAELVNFLKKEDMNHELSDVSAIETNSSSLIQSIDHIKLFSSLNPFDFGVISYLHSQNDILLTTLVGSIIPADIILVYLSA